ncbi:MAG: cyclic nucleotide-binding domain-containing protein [Candidatus Deferrimicrobiaceae bacterium]
MGDLGEGDVFGEMSLLTGEPRRATVVAAGEVWLIEIGKADGEPVLRSDPSLIGRFSDILARREKINLERTKAAEIGPSHGSLVDGFVKKLKLFFNIH